MSAETQDVCIVGTGAGGGVLAHTLVQARMLVISVEQGDAEILLAKGQTVGQASRALGVTEQTFLPSKL